ncbi:MAG: hypothetical protein QF444_06460 [Phycisphaerales bacterium]|nr:hypothetical protein [Phycisphaerales bacterium]
MANRTKAELINEIEHLRTENYERSERLREKSKDIKELKETVRAGDSLIGKQASKIKQLRALWRDTDIESVEKGCKIKELKEFAIEMRNEVNNLQAENHNLSLIIDRKRNDYNDLNEMRNGAVQRSAEKSKEISKLDKAVAQLGGVIGEKDKKIKDLERRLELSEKFSGNKEFHNATVAMGNPQYFQGVSND